jgi:hypothetical protein
MMSAAPALGCTSRRQLVRAAVGALLVHAFGRNRARAALRPVLVVTGAKAPLTTISKLELKRLFLGETVTAGGQRLTPFNLPPSSVERQLFERRVLEMTPEEVAKHWIDRRIRGQSGAPKTAPSAEVLLKIASHFPGAIVYLQSTPLDPGLKALAVEGRASTDPGYLLAG